MTALTLEREIDALEERIEALTADLEEQRQLAEDRLDDLQRAEDALVPTAPIEDVQSLAVTFRAAIESAHLDHGSAFPFHLCDHEACRIAAGRSIHVEPGEHDLLSMEEEIGQ